MITSVGTNLTRIRQARGLTMEELARMVGCTKQSISLYESGQRHPDSQTLLSIAKALDTDIDSFYDSYNVAFELNSVSYREGMLLNTTQRTSVEEQTSAKLSDYLELETIAKACIEFINPIENIKVNNSQDAEKAAKELRKQWKMGDGPVHNISTFLERKGVRIIKIDFGFSYRHEGLSGWAEQKRIPVIVLNARQQDTARVRFTMLHELGHLLLMIEDNLTLEVVERLCDAFAGAVLLPADTLASELGRNRTLIVMPELRRIKELYGISVQAIMVRARVISLISPEVYQGWQQTSNSNQDHGQYQGTEEPQRFLQMLYRCLSEKRIGFDKAAQLAGWDEAELREQYVQQSEF
ncbi:helix-turn-helix domain-containing protein [Fibrella arboris]|uniref:helix-turn-helix domain-containing protein n=1 Tax=Fibrella arboris TaxID=3242486 RepID=UPI003521BFEE